MATSTTTPLPWISLENATCECDLHTFGAHVVSWRVRGAEKLWMSSISPRDGSAPIRGGIPIAFPQFADEGPLKLHGFARESEWSIKERGDDFVVMQLKESDATLRIWPHKFRLEYTVSLLERGIVLELSVANTDDHAWDFSGCLHTYFRFDDTSEVELLGFKESPFIDKADGRKAKILCGPLNVKEESNKSAADAGLEHGFVDRIFPNSPDKYEFRANGKMLYHISHSPSWPDTTIYNPWLGDKQGSKGPDFDDDGYKYTICCEPTISKAHAVELQSGDCWKGSQEIFIPH